MKGTDLRSQLAECRRNLAQVSEHADASHTMYSETAQKLVRERDEARAQLDDQMRATIVATNIQGAQLLEAQSELAHLASLLANALGERDKALADVAWLQRQRLWCEGG